MKITLHFNKKWKWTGVQDKLNWQKHIMKKYVLKGQSLQEISHIVFSKKWYKITY